MTGSCLDTRWGAQKRQAQRPVVCLTAFPLVTRVESSSEHAFPRVGQTREITPSCQKGHPPDKKKKKKACHKNRALPLCAPLCLPGKRRGIPGHECRDPRALHTNAVRTTNLSYPSAKAGLVP